jgi:hypothetical protein
VRFIKTFVLHIYVDPDAPERLCGDARPLDEPETYPFKNLVELEELLRRLTGKPSAPKISPTGRGTLPEEKGIK